MKATKDHISFETAQLIKQPVNISSQFIYGKQKLYPNSVPIRAYNKFRTVISNIDVITPAYTWQEILWEHPERFFGIKFTYDFIFKEFYYQLYSSKILNYLQKGEYEKADWYFREHCILISIK